MAHDQEKAPGLVWIKRKNGRLAPYWASPMSARRAGWPLKTVNLSETKPGELLQRCQRLQAEMHEFLGRNNKPPKKLTYDGTIGSLLSLYETHPQSPYQRLQESSRHPMSTYLRKLKAAHGERLISRLIGLDVLNWYGLWSAPTRDRPKPRLSAAAMALAVLKNALSFGAVSGLRDCGEFRKLLGQVHFEHPHPRDQVPTASDVEAAMRAAHRLGRPSAALAYALQFETAARQWDVVGQWVPMSDPQPSSVLYRQRKWIGPTWASVDASMVLTLTPEKTAGTTRARTRIGLDHCPMVMGEIASIPLSSRTGPLIVNERTGKPYWNRQFGELWRAVRDEAKLSPALWNRDLRAGAITEGGMAGASSDDRAKLAGHTGSKTTRRVYDRDVLVASNRVAEARAKFREKK